MALHASVSQSWCSRVSKGRKGNTQNQKLTTLLSLMPCVSLRFQESSHTKQSTSCFGLGGAQDKSALTCSLLRPQASNPAILYTGVSGKTSCLTLEDIACFSSFPCSVVQVHLCLLLPFPVRPQTRGWVTRCVPAQVSPAAPAPSSTHPPPPTPTERSTGGRKVPATSRLTGSRALLKVRGLGSQSDYLHCGKCPCL